MADTPHPYTPYIAFTMDDFNARAKNARNEAATLITRAEIWEDAARRLETAIEKERQQAAPNPTDASR